MLSVYGKQRKAENILTDQIPNNILGFQTGKEDRAMNENEQAEMERVVADFSDALAGRSISFKRLAGGESETHRIRRVRAKETNLIMEIGEGDNQMAIGFFLPIHCFSVVAKETDEGWTGGDILSDVTIDGLDYLLAYKLAMVGHKFVANGIFPSNDDSPKKCFCCGPLSEDAEPEQPPEYLTAIVDDNAAANEIVAMFGDGAAKVDESQFVMVQIAACPKHIPNLKLLWNMTRLADDEKITMAMIGRACHRAGEVIFQPKSNWQKDDCICYGGRCRNDSFWEAILQKGDFSARIRCCDNEACREHAAVLALECLHASSEAKAEKDDH